MVDKTKEELEIEQENKDVEDFFGENPLEDSEYEDDTLLTVKRAKAIMMFWQQADSEVIQIKEGYNLAKGVGDDALKDVFITQGKPLVKKLKFLEEELKDILPRLKGITFLIPAEIAVLPKWQQKLLGVNKE